jgi:hypothetical protein
MELLRYVLPHVAAGSVAGVAGAAAVIATNVGSLRDLVMHADGGWMACALLMFGFALTFGSAALGHAIVMLGADED